MSHRLRHVLSPSDLAYSFYELQRGLLAPVATLADAAARALEATKPPGGELLRATCALVHRVAKSYDRPAFGIAHAHAHGREVTVREDVIATHPFCRLVRFTRTAPGAEAALAADPRVLVCAPLSGHHPSLVRDTVHTLLADHDVYVTEWLDARDVPVSAGAFSLDDYVRWIERAIRTLGARRLHVLSVCQPTVPVLAAVARLAAAGEPTPRTLTLMGGPIDARVNPTVVDKLATEHPLAWFEAHMIHRVAGAHAGRGRAVYPGWMQLAAFVMMNPARHLESYRDYWFHQLAGDHDAARAHERFYDDYNAVLDMDAAYYLDTVRVVFQEFALARGTWTIDGALVQPAAITDTALFTIEGELDDISGLGQTSAAHTLCTGIPATHRRAWVADGCGHYGLFSGRRWREAIYPELRAFVRAHHEEH